MMRRSIVVCFEIFHLILIHFSDARIFLLYPGTYKPSQIQTEEDYLEWKKLYKDLPRVEEIIASRFKNIAPGLFNMSVEG